MFRHSLISPALPPVSPVLVREVLSRDQHTGSCFEVTNNDTGWLGGWSRSLTHDDIIIVCRVHWLAFPVCLKTWVQSKQHVTCFL